ncbi:hypothetical protein LWI29_004642 [Acer saccharum]|uniref:Uncharacterized protein n=1 Tax=Acer saccharum TaxID=4024 RepID=A0AA39RGI9_ACESA|nr:hypothetical protein LWI29_004642 [Acer saccharum]
MISLSFSFSDSFVCLSDSKNYKRTISAAVLGITRIFFFFSLNPLESSRTDCIGSAFNMKGAMQCPNCWKVEKAQRHLWISA